jgi:hypothetical protein
VAWNEDQKLLRYEEDRRYTVEYKQKYFKMSTRKALRKFIANPEVYVQGYELPEVLPFRVQLVDNARITHEHCKLQGNCPVTIRNSIAQGNIKVVKGKAHCTVSYGSDIFRFYGEKELLAFMSRPDQYASVQLPTKMPPKVQSASAKDMLAIGKHLAFMEQCVSQVLMQALTSLGEKRIKFPGKDMSTSALLYLVYYLKTHNPTNKPYMTARHGKKMRSFLKNCSVIQKLMSNYKSGGEENRSACRLYDKLTDAQW